MRKVLQDVELLEKADTLAKDLSGGQKRKLCVAVALIGNPKVVFLGQSALTAYWPGFTEVVLPLRKVVDNVESVC